MFTQKQKDFMSKLLKEIQLTGRPEYVRQTLELMDSIERELEAQPTEEEKPEPAARKKPGKQAP
jgi:hypothetical protein